MSDQEISLEYGVWPMLRIQALRQYRTEFYHALRNQKPPELAADQALQRVKDTCLKELAIMYPNDEITRSEKWADILLALVEFQILLKDIPVDPNRLQQIPPKVVPLHPGK